MSDDAFNPRDTASYPHEDPDVLIEEVRDGDVVGFHLFPRERTRRGDIVTVGGSKGAEFLLAAVTALGGADHLVLTAPTAYRWPALTEDQGGEERSSWTLVGAETPYLPFQVRTPRMALAVARLVLAQRRGRPIEAGPIYAAARSAASAAALDAARIDVASCPADLLLIAGADDRMWDSAPAAREIRAARGRTTGLILPACGHGPGGPTEAAGLILGGTEAGNEAGGRRAAQVTRAWIEERHPLLRDGQGQARRAPPQQPAGASVQR